ncbi:MAG: phenylalanine--tRNA ligase subunit alpha [Candidatus Saganbacteria bacterium]|nr:phenylalanine--tRNA ligase subunit alpha [Candidatus Saganbacteria bacterium]
MVERIKAVEDEAISRLNEIKNLQELEAWRIRYLGKKGLLTELVKNLKNIPTEDRPHFGKNLNITKNKLENIIKEKRVTLESADKEKKIKSSAVDITMPGKGIKRGKLHPITQVMNEVVDIFLRLGFSIADGPDIETDYYNFEALNIPKHHASRDMWSTLYIEKDTLLRTHTSPVQIRVMEKKKPPLAIIAPGKVYRRDADVTHSTVFHQVEGFMVDKNITFADLKGTLTALLHAIFGKAKRVRFRPSYFPFTEPSAEVDVECVNCGGKGKLSNGESCRVCKETGWLEILGCGMIDPNVFKNLKYDPDKYSGYAFGMGIERIAMLKFGISDIRLFFENDLRFLKQF